MSIIDTIELLQHQLHELKSQLAHLNVCPDYATKQDVQHAVTKIVMTFKEYQLNVTGLTDKLDAFIPQVDALLAALANAPLPPEAQAAADALTAETAKLQTESDKVAAALPTVTPPTP